jgi:hypothetical protein
MGLVAAAAAKVDLTFEDAAAAGARVMLQQAVEGEKFDARGYGELLAGIAKLKDSGSEGDDSQLVAFLADDDEEEEEE